MFQGKYCETQLIYCSKDLNPCKNEAKCVSDGLTNYRSARIFY